MIRAVLAVALLATPVAAADCPQNRAIYTEKDNGYTLTFRAPLRWEASVNTMAVLTLDFPPLKGIEERQSIWGTIWLPNGTSHDRIRFHDGCTLDSLPDPDGDVLPGSTEEELQECLIWEGVIYALAGDDIHDLAWFDDGTAADTLLLPNLGPTIRYSGLVLGPGQEPHDVFTYTGCAPEPS